MLPSYDLLRRTLRRVLADKEDQGHQVAGPAAELAALPDDYERLAAFGRAAGRPAGPALTGARGLARCELPLITMTPPLARPQ